MKRFLAIPLMFIYMIAMSGIVISTHYCGSKLVSWNVYIKAALCGGCDNDGCGRQEKKPMKCCKDKVLMAKVQHDQDNAAQFKLAVKAPVFTLAVLPAFNAVNTALPAISAAARIYQSNAPPGNWQHIPLYKLHSRFTYYG